MTRFDPIKKDAKIATKDDNVFNPFIFGFVGSKYIITLNVKK